MKVLLSVTCQLNIGKLSEKKIEKISEFLNRDFPILVRPSGAENSMVLMNQQTRETMMLTENTVAYSIDMIEYISRFDKIIGAIKAVSDLLMIDNSSSGNIRFIANIENENSDAMQGSKNIAGGLVDNLRLDDVEGIGYRFFIKKLGHLSEFKIEPLITNNKFYYVEGLYNINDFSIESNFIEYGNNVYDDFEKRLTSFKVAVIEK